MAHAATTRLERWRDLTDEQRADYKKRMEDAWRRPGTFSNVKKARIHFAGFNTGGYVLTPDED